MFPPLAAAIKYIPRYIWGERIRVRIPCFSFLLTTTSNTADSLLASPLLASPLLTPYVVGDIYLGYKDNFLLDRCTLLQRTESRERDEAMCALRESWDTQTPGHLVLRKVAIRAAM